MLQQKPANVDRKNIWKLYLEMYLKKLFLIHTLISVYMYRQKYIKYINTHFTGIDTMKIFIVK